VRRSLTISPENERRIQGFRSITLGLEPAIDFDYTNVANLLLDLGFHLLVETGQQGPPQDSVKIDSRRIAYILGYYSGLAFNKESKTILNFKNYMKQTDQAQPGGLFEALVKLDEFQPKTSPLQPHSEKKKAPGKS
jgi:hypothetical protein